MTFLDELKTYLLKIKELHDMGESKEHTYRTVFENFLNSFNTYHANEIPKNSNKNTPKHNITLIQEPKGESSTIKSSTASSPFQKATPDFALKKVKTPKYQSDVYNNSISQIIGYIETKAPDSKHFHSIQDTPQIKKYLTITNNLLVTNYFNFILITKKEDANNSKEPKLIITKVEFGSPKYFDAEAIKLEDAEKLHNLLQTFWQAKPKDIATPKELATYLASRAKFLKTYLEEELLQQKKAEKGELYQLYITFRNNLSENLTYEEFTDAFTQMATYALFLAKLNAPSGATLSISNLPDYIHSNFSLISELVKYLQILTNPNRLISFKCGWLVEELLDVINAMNMREIAERLAYNKQKTTTADPYLYFYEDFLQQYDKGTKVDRGVFYTPPEAVYYIVNSINEILKNELNIEKGLGDTNVKTLDFATGTGTFILEVYKTILSDLPKGSPPAIKNAIIAEHILKNVYGFEYLVAPYAVAHLKLSEYLKSHGYILQTTYNNNSVKQDRIQVYLANTLSELTPQNDNLLPELSQEGEAAHEIKSNTDIMVILGNPPYNSKSKNKLVDNGEQSLYEAMADYKPIDEKNIQLLDDDYIKFIRFAHKKLSKVNKGVIGVIVNNSFINGLIHRKMRNSLLEEFSSIYILNLHGDARKKERTPEGGVDQNIFSIMQGVCIALFVKNNSSTKSTTTDFNFNISNKLQPKSACKVYYADLYGMRAEKKAYLAHNTYSSTTWEELNIAKFNEDFNKTNWAVNNVEWSKHKKQAPETKKALMFEGFEEHYEANERKEYIPQKRFVDDLSFFVPMQNNNILTYGDGIALTEIFKQYASGVKSSQDNITVQVDKDYLEVLLIDFKTKELSYITSKYNIIQNKEWKLDNAQKVIATSNGSIAKINYRPFDERYTYYSKDKGFLERPRYEIMQNFLTANLGVTFSRSSSNNIYNEFLISKSISDINLLSGQTYVAPLYITKETTKKLSKQVSKTKTNYSYQEDRKIIGTNFSSYFQEFIKNKYTKEYTPEEILAYIYAIMYSPSYKEKYLEYLKIDFPRIIFYAEDVFQKLIPLGQQLIDLHLLKTIPKGEVELQYDSTNFVASTDSIQASKSKEDSAKRTSIKSKSNNKVSNPFIHTTPSSTHKIIPEEATYQQPQSLTESNFKVEKAIYYPHLQKLNINKFVYFNNVPENVYNYEIANQKVLEKYINARKFNKIHRELTLDEIEHIKNIVKVLQETLVIENKIDEIIKEVL
ncbi:N-6 DNA methylase [Candidatus Hepatincola sp. Pdp]